jgi:transcriptional regulator with XRE-family HTH domain
MEFHEKLQELRKNRKLTQEELAEALFVSRTAISKWESGRGYPNIDSLKEISRYFCISIDDLLSSEKLLSIAEQENKSNIRNMRDLLLGIMDLMSIMLICLPLYPNTIEGYVYSVNLFQYVEISPPIRMICWVLFIALILIGIVKILFAKFKYEKYSKLMTGISLILSIFTVIFLALARITYATTAAFVLLVVKGILIINR